MGIDSADTSQQPKGQICMDFYVLPNNPARQSSTVTPPYQMRRVLFVHKIWFCMERRTYTNYLQLNVVHKCKSISREKKEYIRAENPPKNLAKIREMLVLLVHIRRPSTVVGPHSFRESYTMVKFVLVSQGQIFQKNGLSWS